MVDPVISLDGLGKSLGQTVAVNRISMAIGEGEIFGFLLENLRFFGCAYRVSRYNNISSQREVGK